MNRNVRAAFKRAYFDFVVRDCDRTDADLALLEANGLMRSRVLTDDDDFFGLDTMEPGETVYEFTAAGLKLFPKPKEPKP